MTFRSTFHYGLKLLSVCLFQIRHCFYKTQRKDLQSAREKADLALLVVPRKVQNSMLPNSKYLYMHRIIKSHIFKSNIISINFVRHQMQTTLLIEKY